MKQVSSKYSRAFIVFIVGVGALLALSAVAVKTAVPKYRPLVIGRGGEKPMAGQFYSRFVKRLMDLVISIMVLLVAWPVMIVVAILVRTKLGSPVIFRQQRPGLNGKPFMMYKFRTMTDERDADGNLLPDSVRVTPFGKFLRRSSLDELPELWNVIRGDMSLVGPRPLLMKYLDRYTPEQFRRHEVRPGVTGWAQINGRNAIGWDEKFAYDVWYVDHCSLILDIKIMILTGLKVVRREGISAAGHFSAPEFKGATKE